MNQDDIYQQFQALFPYMMEVADEVTTKETQIALTAIVVSEVGDTDLAVQYIQSFRVENLTTEKRMVRFVAASDKIKTLERGISSYSIKEKMLQAGKPGVKMSKAGYLYRSVALNKDAPVEGKKISQKEEEIQSQIKDILAGANMALKMAFTNKKTKEYVVVDRTRGLSRTRVFESKDSFNADEKPKKSQVVIFRTMSQRPGTSEWQHPGVSGKNIKGKIDKWLSSNEDVIFNEVLDNLMAQFFGA